MAQTESKEARKALAYVQKYAKSLRRNLTRLRELEAVHLVAKGVDVGALEKMLDTIAGPAGKGGPRKLEIRLTEDGRLVQVAPDRAGANGRNILPLLGNPRKSRATGQAASLDLARKDPPLPIEWLAEFVAAADRSCREQGVSPFSTTDLAVIAYRIWEDGDRPLPSEVAMKELRREVPKGRLKTLRNKVDLARKRILPETKK